MARLVVRLGAKNVSIVNLDIPTVTVGRGTSAQIVLDDPLVSREHCRFRLAGDGHIVLDLDSKTGTYINGDKLTGSQILEPGDEVGVGKHTLRYEYGEARVAKSKDGPENTARFWLEGLAESNSQDGIEAPKAIAPDEIAQSASDLQPAAGPDAGMQDYQGTMLASTAQVARAREMAAIVQQPHLKFKHRGSTRHAAIHEGFEVGYTADADFVLEGSRVFGRRQFRVEPADGGFYIEVLSFWAKVLVNGARVRGRARIQGGARIKAGGKTFAFGAGE